MNSTQMTESEISFLEQFIKTNLSDTSSGNKAVTTDVMELSEVYKEYNLNQYNVYSSLGVLQNALFNPGNYGLGPNRELTQNIYSPNSSSPKYVSTKIGEATSNQTKLYFLGDWSACAEKILDSKLSDLFLRLKDIYDIEPYPSYGRWKYCRWKGK